MAVPSGDQSESILVCETQSDKRSQSYTQHRIQPVERLSVRLIVAQSGIDGVEPKRGCVEGGVVCSARFTERDYSESLAIGRLRGLDSENIKGSNPSSEK